MLRSDERVDQQSRTSKDRQRNGYLRDHQRVPQRNPALSSRRRLRAAAQAARQIGARCANRGRESKQQRCQDCRHNTEQNHARIHVHGQNDRHVGRQLDHRQRANRPVGHHHSGRAAHHCQHQAFSQELPDEASASCSDREANRDLSRARDAPCQHQVGKIRTGDQQHQSRDAHQRQRKHSIERIAMEPSLQFLLNDQRPILVRLRVRLRQPGAKRGKFGLRSLEWKRRASAGRCS